MSGSMVVHLREEEAKAKANTVLGRLMAGGLWQGQTDFRQLIESGQLVLDPQYPNLWHCPTTGEVFTRSAVSAAMLVLRRNPALGGASS